MEVSRLAINITQILVIKFSNLFHKILKTRCKGTKTTMAVLADRNR